MRNYECCHILQCNSEIFIHWHPLTPSGYTGRLPSHKVTLLCSSRMTSFTLPSRSAQEGSTIHAFAHALSTLLTYLREELVNSPPDEGQPTDSAALATTWLYYEKYEAILLALSSVCGRVRRHAIFILLYQSLILTAGSTHVTF